jgi:hypothetical protein
LLESGRKVYLSVGPHGRPPRSYRGRDFVWWLGVLNNWDTEYTPGSAHVTIAVSGAQGLMRLVTHHQVSAEDVDEVVTAFRELCTAMYFD